jgi:DNA invertase Pin-like site-specific DNA recombinase
MPSTNGHGPKQAVLYARVSTDEQAKSGYSLAQQLEALREYAAREDYEVLEEVSDPGQSGASLERPGMDRVRDLVAAGSVSVVLAQDRDRFAREPAYHYLLRREFEEHGCVLRALNDCGDDSPEGELTDGILDQLAKFERAKIAERTRRGKVRKAKEGKIAPASSGPTFGFAFNEARDGFVIHEPQMRLVRAIFRMIRRGMLPHNRRTTDVGRARSSCPRWRTAVVPLHHPQDRTKRLLQTPHPPGGRVISRPRGHRTPRPGGPLRRKLVGTQEGHAEAGGRERARWDQALPKELQCLAQAARGVDSHTRAGLGYPRRGSRPRSCGARGQPQALCSRWALLGAVRRRPYLWRLRPQDAVRPQAQEHHRGPLSPLL